MSRSSRRAIEAVLSSGRVLLSQRAERNS